eukprot:2796049-Amphidinium_carterae.1
MAGGSMAPQHRRLPAELALPTAMTLPTAVGIASCQTRVAGCFLHNRFGGDFLANAPYGGSPCWLRMVFGGTMNCKRCLGNCSLGQCTYTSQLLPCDCRSHWCSVDCHERWVSSVAPGIAGMMHLMMLMKSAPDYH